MAQPAPRLDDERPRRGRPEPRLILCPTCNMTTPLGSLVCGHCASPMPRRRKRATAPVGGREDATALPSASNGTPFSDVALPGTAVDLPTPAPVPEASTTAADRAASGPAEPLRMKRPWRIIAIAVELALFGALFTAAATLLAGFDQSQRALLATLVLVLCACLAFASAIGVWIGAGWGRAIGVFVLAGLAAAASGLFAFATRNSVVFSEVAIPLFLAVVDLVVTAVSLFSDRANAWFRSR